MYLDNLKVKGQGHMVFLCVFLCMILLEPVSLDSRNVAQAWLTSSAGARLNDLVFF